MSKEKALYQVYLILNCLSDSELSMIPEDDLDYIKSHMQEDDEIIIDPMKDLEDQDISDFAYDYLEKLMKKINFNQIEDSNDDIITLKSIIAKLEKENEIIPKAQKLLQEYSKALKDKTKEIDNLKKQNTILLNNINNLPKFIKKIFFKDLDSKLLNKAE